MEDLSRLDQGQRLEQLVECPEAAGEDHETLGRFHEHRLARVEVAEGELDVEVGVFVLLVRQFDVEADREAAAFLRAAVCGLHHARAAAGHDGEASLGKAPADLAGLLVGGMTFVHPRRAEQRDRRPVDPLDRFESLQELVADPGRVREEIVALAAFE